MTIKRRRTERTTRLKDGRGRWTLPAPPLEPPAPLLEALRFVGRGTVRQVYNCPRVTVHVERMMLEWLMDWDPVNDPPVRQALALKAANEARRLKALTPAKRTLACSRSSKTRALRLVRG